MKTRNALAAIRRDLRERSIFLAVLVLFLAVSALDSRFCSWSNVLSILADSSYRGVAAIGMTLCIVFGAFDLSVGAMLSFVSVVTVAAAPHLVPPLTDLLGPAAGPALFLLLMALLGVACGLLNGALVAFLRIPAFIATLGMMYCYRGSAFLASGGNDLAYREPWFLRLAGSDWLGVPAPFVIFAGLTALGTYLLNCHPFGRQIQAIGNSRRAARAAGYSLTRATLLVFALVGLFTALAAILQSSLLYGAQPGRGVEFELYVIAAVVLGGTSLSGGQGSVINTLGASILLAALQSAFSFLEANPSLRAFVSPYMQKVILGLVMLIAFSMRFVHSLMEEHLQRFRLRRQVGQAKR